MESTHGTRRTRARIGVATAGLLLGGGGLLVGPGLLDGASAATDPPWQTVRLQPLAEGEATHVAQISNAGVSVGRSGDAPVRWDAAGQPTELPLPEGCTTGEATSITRQGQVAAGIADCGDGADQRTGVIWSANGSAIGVAKLEAPLGVRDVSAARFAVGQRDPESDSADRAFVFVQGRPRLDLPDGDGTSSEANAITDYGYIVGTAHGVPTLPESVAVGWYGDQVFPLLQFPVDSEGIDTTESAYSLVQVRGTINDHPLVITPQGEAVNLNSEGATDVGVDITENGFVLGYRTVEPDDEATVGMVYLSNGAALRLDALPSSSDVEAYGFDRPAAMSDLAMIVGNHGDVSWLLKPPTGAGTTTTTGPGSSSSSSSSSTSSSSTSSTTSSTVGTVVPTLPPTTEPSSPTVTAGE